jgi:VWFA-related protein
MSLRRFRSSFRLIWCALAASALAQQPATPAPKTDAGPAGQTTTLSLDAKLVNLPVLVRDKKGALVQSLTKDDFTLSVDGHPETIRYFDKDNDLPLTVGLLVDVSGSVSNTLDAERTASSAFLDQMLSTPANRPADRAFIIQFSRSTELLQDLTSSRPKLQAAIKELGSPDPHAQQDPDNGGNNNNGGSGNSHRRGGTTLYDAVFLSADELLSKQTGRKAIVLLTDGEDNGSKESLNRCIEAAQRADTIVYAVYFKGEEHHDQQSDNRGGGYPGGGGGYPGGGHRGGGPPGGGQESRIDGKKVLEKMTAETGGRMFEVKKGDFAGIYNQIAEELRSQYRLAFTPDKAILDDGYHTVDLLLPKKKDLRIQTRDGYYTGK